MSIFRWIVSHWVSCIVAVALVGVDVFDSFGLDRAADTQAAPLLSTLTAPFYGGSVREGQDSITVVLIDETSLSELGWDAQPAYADQAELVSAIARFKPAAIFLDYYYTFPHGEDPAREIAQFAQRLKDESEINGVPIRLGPVGDGPVFAPLRQIPSLGVSWTGLDLLSVPFAAADGSPIASYGLYRIWCQDRGIDCNWTPKGDLTLTWGFGVSDRALRFAAEEDAACALNSNSFAGKAVAGASHFTRAMFRAALYDEGGQSVRRDPLESRCFYNDTLIASHVMSGALDQEIAPLLENRIVLIGAAHARPADRHHIPQVGMVPGVYIHAMALDNLIEQGHDYVQQAPQIIYALDAADLVELVVTGLILLMAIQFRRAAARAPDHWRTPRLPLTIFLAGVALIAAAIVSMTLLHWPPINVLGVAALLSSLEFVFDSRERRARDGLS